MQTTKQMASAALMAFALSQAQADTTLFQQGFENVSGLAGQGWSFWNVGQNPSGEGWFQGQLFLPAEDGPLDSYIYSGFNASMNNTLGSDEYISAWLVTPEIQLTGQDTLHFWIEGPGGNYLKDSLRILIAPGNASAPGDFVQTLFNISSPPPFWLPLEVQLPANMSSVRIAFQYYGSNATAGTLALDSLSITSAVPEPSSWLLMTGGVLGLAALRHRRRRAGRP